MRIILYVNVRALSTTSNSLLFLQWYPTYNRHFHRVVIVERFDCGQREIQQDCHCGLQYIISTDGK